MSGSANQGPTTVTRVPGHGTISTTSSGTGSADTAPKTSQQARGFFSHKKLDVTFYLGTGAFGESGFNTIRLAGLRVSASVVKNGSAGLNTAQLRVWGMTLSQMNQLSSLGLKQAQSARRNEVLLEAGDDRSNVRTTVFHGDIIDCWADPQSQPDVPFLVNAITGYGNALKPVTPTSYKGVADVAVMMHALADRMGLTFENSGVTGKSVIDCYLPGTAKEQAKRLAEQANISMALDDKTLAIWPKGSARGNVIPIISSRTGMVGYPTYTETGVMVTTIYNPQLVAGQRAKVESILKMAYGEFIVGSLTHTLDSEVPSGNWFSRMRLDNLFGGRSTQ
jgi:hypothetical protein